MKIWIFNHYAIAPGSSGITRHFDLAKELVKRGHEVTIFASSFDHQTRKEKYIFDSKVKVLEKYYQGVRFIWIKTFPYKKNDWRRVINMLSYTYRAYFFARKKNLEDPDIIIGSLMHPLAPLLAYYISRKRKCKFYFEERDLWPQTLIDLGKVSKNNPIVWLLSKLELFLYKKADRIIVLFDKAVNYVKSRGVEENKVVYLPNGVDLDLYDCLVDNTLPYDYEETFNKLSGKFIGIYIGAHGLANNLDSLLDTAKILCDRNNKIHFVLVGDGPEKERLIQRAKEEKISNVSFLPPISKDKIPYILKKADVGLISMWDAQIYKWGFSLNKSYDYMAAGLPIIIKCSYPNLIEQSGAVLRVKTPMEMAKTIEKICFNKPLLEKMGNKSREYVRANHSWYELSRKLEFILLSDVE